MLRARRPTPVPATLRSATYGSYQAGPETLPYSSRILYHARAQTHLSSIHPLCQRRMRLATISLSFGQGRVALLVCA